jgi:hypothetical protein
MQIVALLAELKGIGMQVADVGNAHLEAVTLEKACFVAGSEFGEQADGHTLVVHKALCGLSTSRARWGEKFADALRLQGEVSSHVAQTHVCRCETQKMHGSTSAFMRMTLLLV